MAVQWTPSQPSIIGIGPLPKALPTAKALVPLRAAIASRKPPSCGGTGSGLGCRRHCVPSQCSTSGLRASPFGPDRWPTAQTLLLDEPPTADRPLFPVRLLNPLGVGTIVHFEPFQCSASVRYFGADFIGPFAPTTQISWADITASPPTVPAGLGRYRHLVPSQRMKTVISCPPAVPRPVAQASVGEIAATAVSSVA